MLSVKPCGCARSWSNDGATTQPVTHDVPTAGTRGARRPAPQITEAGRFAADHDTQHALPAAVTVEFGLSTGALPASAGSRPEISAQVRT